MASSTVRFLVVSCFLLATVPSFSNETTTEASRFKAPDADAPKDVAQTWSDEDAPSFSNEMTTEASRFKAPNDETPKELAETWKNEDEALWTYVHTHVPAVLQHTGAEAFDLHLKGVQALLRGWGAPTHLTSAGLFHSIYGTEGFQGFALPLSERRAIQSLIGAKAEKLCFVFCMVDRSTVDETVIEYNKENDASSSFRFRARPELGRFDIRLNREEWLDFIELTLADWLEQVEGAAKMSSDSLLWKTGQAYAYRRQAYHKMGTILAAERNRLSTIVPDMVEAVYGTEAPETRQLMQPRTPPVSQAAKDALNALRAAGEDIPENLAPAKEEECEAL